jgi:FeS assembly SUF system protein
MSNPQDDKDLFDFMPGDKAATTVERPEPGEKDPELEARVLAAMKTVQDPEIPVDLVELGLIYELEVSRGGTVFVEMTLTSPACPVAGALPGEVETAIRGVDGVTDVRVKLVFTPPWTPDRMSEEAKLELGML